MSVSSTPIDPSRWWCRPAHALGKLALAARDYSCSGNSHLDEGERAPRKSPSQARSRLTVKDAILLALTERHVADGTAVIAPQLARWESRRLSAKRLAT